jgi:hypothetical protein
MVLFRGQLKLPKSFIMLPRIATFGVMIGTILLLCLFVFGWPIRDGNVMGCAPADVRKQYGEPWRIVDMRKAVPGDDEYTWYYRRGLIGMSTITFKKDVVTEVSHGTISH